jgi:hypothetical protein
VGLVMYGSPHPLTYKISNHHIPIYIIKPITVVVHHQTYPYLYNATG